ncbi:hypothetical protein TcasGA2_TC010276 [Tribolium castaneum]|uniref:Uncharacterized protein n=1 Tax=Tribolium castaneum TaxID=7070 RepID=D7EJJ9_TRICA|nr:hypothetical protein TcasGA2_TC010276 [Tribolium castaneum]
MKCKEPDETWKFFGVSVLGNGKVYGKIVGKGLLNCTMLDSYLKARAAAQRAEETSNINSDSEEKKRKRYAKKRFEIEEAKFSDDDEEVELQKEDFPSLPSTKILELPKFQISRQENSSTPASSSNTIKQILRQQCIINLKLNNIQGDLTTILQQISLKNGINVEEDLKHQDLPLKNIRNLETFEKFLGEDDNLQKFEVLRINREQLNVSHFQFPETFYGKLGSSQGRTVNPDITSSGYSWNSQNAKKCGRKEDNSTMQIPCGVSVCSPIGRVPRWRIGECLPDMGGRGEIK